jgi:tetratricopeptide (TPR) repeat protein
VVAGVAAVFGIWVGVNRPVPSTRPARARFQEDDETRQREIKAAMAERKPLAPDEITRELQPLFDDLGAAFRAADGERIVGQFDLERLVDECAELAPGMLRTPNEKRAFVQGMRRGMGDGLKKQAAVVQWTKFEIRNVKKLNPDEVVAIVRHQTPNGVTLKLRWWMTRRSGSWKVYDMEDLETGIRMSSTMGALLAQGIGPLAETARAMRVLDEALSAAVFQQNMDAAEKKLAEIERVNLPGRVEALRHMVYGTIRLNRGQFEQALQSLDRAAEIQPDMPILDVLRGTALNKLGRWDQARKHLEAYRDLMGDDAGTYAQLGLSLRGLRRFPEAARAYRKALDLDPKDADAFFGLLKAVTEDDIDDLAERFLKLDARRENYDTFAADCERRQFHALLEPLAVAMCKNDPDYAPPAYHLAMIRARGRATEAAVPLFRTAMAKQTDAEKRREYTHGFLEAMASVGMQMDAYAAVPDAREAFRFLAADALKKYRTDLLKRLVAAHGKEHAADPLLPWYQAALHVREGHYALAEKAFVAALKNPPDAETLAQFREPRVLARYHAGDFLSAYRDIGPRDETFLQLAGLCFWEETDDHLQALLDAHAANDPESLDLLRFRCRLKLRQQRVDEGIALFKALLARKPADEKRATIINEFLAGVVQAGKPLEGYRAAPDPKQAFQTLGGQLLNARSFDDLRRLVEAHRAGHPDDPWLAYYEGEVHLKNEAWDPAARVLAEGLKRAPKDERETFRTQYVFAMYRAGRGQQAYTEAEGDERDDVFTQLANLLTTDRKGPELAALVRARRAHAAEDADLYFYEALARLFAKRPDEAVPLFKKGCEQQPNVQLRRGHVSRFLYNMEEAGLALDGYRAAPEKDLAFQTLAYRLLHGKKEKELVALLEEHGKGRAKDPMHQFFTGELHLLRGDAAEADRQFTALVAECSPDQKWRFANALFRARIKLGRAVGAYQDVEPGPRAFESLASLCEEARDADQLQALIDAHRKASPDDPNLPAWDLEVRWLKQDYEGVVKMAAGRPAEVDDTSHYGWKIDDRLVRSLVKLKRASDAVREAETVTRKQNGNPLLLVLAHAASGDVKQTMALLEKRQRYSYFLRSCYQDPDLGPILRSEPFRALREKFPEPKDLSGPDFDPDDP